MASKMPEHENNRLEPKIQKLHFLSEKVCFKANYYEGKKKKKLVTISPNKYASVKLIYWYLTLNKVQGFS